AVNALEHRCDVREKDVASQLPTFSFGTAFERVKKIFERLSRGVFDHAGIVEVDWRDCRFNSDLEIVGAGHKNLMRRCEVGRRALFDVLANFFAQTKRRLRLSLLTLWNDQDSHPPRDRLAGCVSSGNRASE